MASVFLKGIALENFRAIGPRVYVGPFQDINFFIGPNNVGKSTVLIFLANHLNASTQNGRQSWARNFDPAADARIGKSVADIKFAFGIDAQTFENNVLGLSETLSTRFSKQITRLQDAISIQEMAWIEPNERKEEPKLVYDESVLTTLTDNEWHGAWAAATSRTGGGVQHWRSELLQRMAQVIATPYPTVHLIPAIREVSEKGASFDDYSGKGLIDKLAELQNPPLDAFRQLKGAFNRINDFLRNVTETPDATIEIPHDRRYILVHMNGVVLPLSSLGTGIHEVVMIASFCTLLENSIVCVEEPEIHLHPVLQRKLIRYLKENTSNQYFIATHSASVLDAVPASIFSVENPSGEALVKLCVTPGERHDVCRTLGYKASDLLQANAIIWVEGPSDRAYIKHWIAAIDDELVEGIDYSIMFYGGRLLSHLSADDPEVDDFISLRRLNRNVAVVMDSDKLNAHTKLNSTKERVIRELGESFSWVTKGREIENYVAVEAMERALAAEYDRFDRLSDSGQFAHRLYFIDKVSGSEVTKVDKIKIAKRIAQEPADLAQLDLAKKVRDLVAFIRRANHH